MSDYWIVVSHKYMRHWSIEKAKAEQARLTLLSPDIAFEILRCKTTVEVKADNRARIIELEDAIRNIVRAAKVGSDPAFDTAISSAIALLPVPMTEISREMHRALVEAGYAPLEGYVERFGLGGKGSTRDD